MMRGTTHHLAFHPGTGIGTGIRVEIETGAADVEDLVLKKPKALIYGRLRAHYQCLLKHYSIRRCRLRLTGSMKKRRIHEVAADLTAAKPAITLAWIPEPEGHNSSSSTRVFVGPDPNERFGSGANSLRTEAIIRLVELILPLLALCLETCQSLVDCPRTLVPGERTCRFLHEGTHQFLLAVGLL
jgi:hypothetical protein